MLALVTPMAHTWEPCPSDWMMQNNMRVFCSHCQCPACQWYTREINWLEAHHIHVLAFRYHSISPFVLDNATKPLLRLWDIGHAWLFSRSTKKMLNIQIRFAEIHIVEELPTIVEKMAVFFFFVVFCFSSELAPSFRFAQRLFFIFFTCLQWLQVTNSAFHCHLPISWVVQMVLWQLYISSVAWSLIARLQDNFLINWWSLLSWGRRCTDGTLIIVICWGIILTSCRLTGLGLSAINWETYFNTQHADLVA